MPLYLPWHWQTPAQGRTYSTTKAHNSRVAVLSALDCLACVLVSGSRVPPMDKVSRSECRDPQGLPHLVSCKAKSQVVAALFVVQCLEL